MKSISYVIIVLVILILFGCKSVEKTTKTSTINEKFNDEGKIVGRETVVEETIIADNGFTLGFSEGDSKVIDFLNVNVLGASMP